MPHPVQIYFGAWISSELDAANKRWKRSTLKLADTRKKLEGLLGRDYLYSPGEDVVQKWKPKNSIAAFKLLRIYRDALSWVVLTDADQAALATDTAADADLPAFIASLSRAAQAHEFCLCSLGWLTGMMDARGGRSEPDDISELAEHDQASGALPACRNRCDADQHCPSESWSGSCC